MRPIVRLFLVVAIATVATWTAAAGGARKVIVLPVEGDADAAQRTQLTQDVVKVAKSGGGTVTTGNTTFAETAAAVGCDPTTPACGDTVLATLGVDEVVFGTATTTNGETTLVVTRIAKGQPRRDQTATIATTDTPEKRQDALRPLWGGAAPAGSGSDEGSGLLGSGSGSGSGLAIGSGTETSFFDTRERKLGVGFAAGGAVAVLVGLALWASESSLQSEINSAPATTAADIAALRDKEDRASRYAWEGNIAVLLGLAAGGVGAYFLWTDHQHRSASATVVPVEQGTGAAVVVRGRW